MTAEEIRQRVLDLWDQQDGWIPGGCYRQLAEAIGVDPERLLLARQTRPKPYGREVT